MSGLKLVLWLACIVPYLLIQIALADDLLSPLDYQVVQQGSKRTGTILVRGMISGEELDQTSFQYRLVTHSNDESEPIWQKLECKIADRQFHSSIEAPAGGWYRLELKASDGKAHFKWKVEHVGVGELFVVAGQSNSANYGEAKLETATQKVVAFDGARWQLARDPQPGAGGDGGSFIPPLGDALSNKFNVPIGFIALGIGATSVREWLPKGATFPNPPTIETLVERLPNGQWMSKGQAFANLIDKTKAFGPHGFRAVLWHQGESDANQSDATRTLPGELYSKYLSQIIHESRREVGWEVPWFVAQASYHRPGDEGSEDIRAAQKRLWIEGIALEGPDSDALTGEFRDQGGQGVHFSKLGLIEHAAKWAEKITPWLEQNIELSIRP